MREESNVDSQWSPTEFDRWGRYYRAADSFYLQQKLHFADMYAKKCEARGHVDHAFELWGVARPLQDALVDSLACQVLLKSSSATQADLLKAQQRWASAHALREFGEPKSNSYDGSRKIRVGYICAWWNSATIRGQVIPFISHHDRSRFSVAAYSHDACDETITQHFDRFVIAGGLSDTEFVRRVRADSIDILIELTGFSPHHRFAALSARCAPIQISYLNHAGTSGVANIDYLLADEIAAPAGIDSNFTETIYRLPGSFFCFNYDWDKFPAVADPPCLKTGYVTFGCFGSQSKVNDGLIKLWADLLKRVPGSKLYLRNMGLADPASRGFMTRRFARWGISPDQLRIEPGADRYTILKAYSEVDISLDTWPYCGGNTIAESMWLGVPVITLKGQAFPSAYGASLLYASGCQGLVANSPPEYCEIAAKLSEDRDRLVYYRNNLRKMMFEHGFSDAEKFARKLETAFVEMMSSHFKVCVKQ